MNRRGPILSLMLLISFSPLRLSAQSATVTTGVLFRTFMVKTDKDAGTIFSIDVDNREYWITAKHILTGKKTPPHGEYTSKTVSLSVLSSLVTSQSAEVNWVPHTFTVLDPGKDIDIVVLVSEKRFIDKSMITATAGSIGTMLGGDCEFIGFPYGNAWRAKYENKETLIFPFIKRCTVSGRIDEPQNLWVLDGMNNEGFSGGPVVFGTGSAQKIFAVISGYRADKADVIPAENASPQNPRPKEYVNVNSGFIVAYDIQYALDAIKKNPIGPLREPK